MFIIMLPILLFAIIAATIIYRIILKKRNQKDIQKIEQYTLADNEIDKLSQYFVNKDEKYISSLGNGYIMNYLVNGKLNRGFAVISNKRVYFRGSCFSGQGKSFHKTDEERTVDIKDVTGSGFVYQRYIGILLGLLTAFLVLISSTMTSVLIAGSYLQEAKRTQQQIEKYQQQATNEYPKQAEEYQKQVEEYQKQAEEAKQQADFYLQQAKENQNQAKKTQQQAELYQQQAEADWQRMELHPFQAEEYRKRAEGYQQQAEEYQSQTDGYQQQAEEYQSQAKDCQRQAENYQRQVENCQSQIGESQQNAERSRQRVAEKQQELEELIPKTTFVSAIVGLCMTFLVSVILVLLDYFKKRKTLFRIEYAGGCIAFDVSFYAKAEIDDFQKQLRRAKDLAEEAPASKIAVTEPSAQRSVPDDLRKYADLLKEGLISQEEYDVMKKKILNL